MLVSQINDDTQKQKAQMIANTGKLLLSQILMLLDNSLLAFKHFEPQYGKENVV